MAKPDFRLYEENSKKFMDICREYAPVAERTRDALNAKFGSATIVRGSSLESKIDVGKKYKAQMEQKKK